MKKKLTLLLLIVIIFITGCTSNKSKTVIDSPKFTESATNNSFTVSDNSDNYKEQNYIISSTIAKIDDLVIEFVIYDSEDTAKKAQEQQIDNFNLLKSPNSFVNKSSGKNYYHYSMTSNNYYMISTRVENTLIFSKVKEEDKDKVENVINELNY